MLIDIVIIIILKVHCASHKSVFSLLIKDPISFSFSNTLDEFAILLKNVRNLSTSFQKLYCSNLCVTKIVCNLVIHIHNSEHFLARLVFGFEIRIPWTIRSKMSKLLTAKTSGVHHVRFFYFYIFHFIFIFILCLFVLLLDAAFCLQVFLSAAPPDVSTEFRFMGHATPVVVFFFVIFSSTFIAYSFT